MQFRSQVGVPTEYRPWQTQMQKMYWHTVPARSSTLLSTYWLVSYWGINYIWAYESYVDVFIVLN